jgi:hypothetical protein
MSKVKIGRWIYCKYCHKMVKPLLGSVHQVLCPECSYGLTPDFFSAKALEIYVKTEDYDLASNCDEEIVAFKAIKQATADGEEIFNMIRIKNDKIVNDLGVLGHGIEMDDNHRPQPYARAISELAIKKWKKQRTIIQNSLK